MSRHCLDLNCTVSVTTILMWNLVYNAAAAVLSLHLVSKYCMTPRLCSLSPRCFMTDLLQFWPPTLLFWIFSSLTLVVLASSLCPIFLFFFLLCILLHPSLPFSHSHPPSSARLYQGLGKLSVHWVSLNPRNVHDCQLWTLLCLGSHHLTNSSFSCHVIVADSSRIDLSWMFVFICPWL